LKHRPHLSYASRDAMSDLASRPVVIAGMHRSGTSLTASFLNDLGVHLGNEQLRSNRTNLAGFFEDVGFVELHGRILAAATKEEDGGHRDWGWTESEFFDRTCLPSFWPFAQELISARATGPGPWGWKDPRTTLLLDFWDQVLAGHAVYVLLYRFPWEVANSIQRLGATVFLEHPECAIRIWSFYNRHLLDFYRRVSDRAVLVSSNALHRNPQTFVDLLRGKLRLDLGEASFDQVWRQKLFATFDANDPLISLTAATSPKCSQLLLQLDANADLSASGLWNASRIDGTALRLPDPVDLSVVIPCYNQGEFLVDAIASVERTATEKCELIIVNDGSTETRTIEVLEVLRKAGYCILDRANAGLAAARNNGIRAARGQYILPLDADNRLAPGFIPAAIAVLKTKSDVGVVYGDRLEFGARSGRAHIPTFNLNLLLRSNYIDACAVYRREVWSSCGGYDAGAAVLEDWEFWIAAAQAGWRFFRLDEVTFEYRVRPNSMLALAGLDVQSSTHNYILRKHRTLYRDVISMNNLSLEAAAAISLRVTGAPPQEVKASAMFKLIAEVINGSDNALFSVGPCPVRLAYHWVENTTRQMTVFDGLRTGLFPGVRPNSVENYPVTVLAPAQPGKYILQITMVQEGVFWFENVRPDILHEFVVSVV
jgi:hypothetical protein